MGDWSIESFLRDANGFASHSLVGWADHASFFEETIKALLDSRWLHPWENWRANFLRTGREQARKVLILPAHHAHHEQDVGGPGGEPGSDEEAQSYCLNLMTISVVRSFARSGYLAFIGLPTVGVGEHRRTVEAMLQIELLADQPELALECWRLASQHTTKERKANLFRQRADRIQQAISNRQNYPDAGLTPLQLLMRRSAEDAGLHLGPHAGVHHGAAGKAPGIVSPFDVAHEEVGMFAWRFAAQLRTLVDVLSAKLSWIDASAWRRASSELQKRSSDIEAADERRRGLKPTPRPPWSSLPDVPLP